LMEMDVLYGNRHVLDMITSHWPAARIGRTRDSVSIRIQLPHQQRQRPETGSEGGPAAVAV